MVPSSSYIPSSETQPGQSPIQTWDHMDTGRPYQLDVLASFAEANAGGSGRDPLQAARQPEESAADRKSVV